jgi:hypothetical protein
MKPIVLANLAGLAASGRSRCRSRSRWLDLVVFLEILPLFLLGFGFNARRPRVRMPIIVRDALAQRLPALGAVLNSSAVSFLIVLPSCMRTLPPCSGTVLT